MKPWELTLSAVEITQLDFYGIDRNFLEIEEIIIIFIEETFS